VTRGNGNELPRTRLGLLIVVHPCLQSQVDHFQIGAFSRCISDSRNQNCAVFRDASGQEIILGSEVAEEGALGDASRFCDLCHIRLAEPLLFKQGDGRVEDGVTYEFLFPGPKVSLLISQDGTPVVIVITGFMVSP
jgi:hypothetical protein